MKRFILLATILLAIVIGFGVYSQPASTPAAQPATAIEVEARSVEYWLDNPADAQIFWDAYSLSRQPASRWVLDYPEDARFYVRWYRAYPRQETSRWIPDYPLDGKIYVEHYR
jgi:hypothetical protein